jgi:hypothetical protein
MPDWIPSRDAIFDLPPEMAGGLTFHLPMEMVAWADASAPRHIVEARVRERLVEAYATGLVDPPLYRWAVGHYQTTAEALLSERVNERLAAFRTVHALGDGLAGAAFHGLIRLGYGAWQRDEAEVARGLAYLRTRRQVLASAAGFDDGIIAVPDDLPGADVAEGTTVFDLLNLVAGTGLPGRVLIDPASISVRTLVAEACGLVRRNPSSFVAVHAVTGLHALCEVHIAVTGDVPTDPLADSPLWSWWQSYAVAAAACALIVESSVAETDRQYDGRYGVVSALDGLVANSVHSGDTHDVKLAVALRRLVGVGLISEPDAIATELARLMVSPPND